MSSFLKPKEARETFACPLARTFDKKAGPNCDADKCIMWRWLPLPASDPRFLGAIKREEAMLAQEKAKETGDKAKPQHLYHKKAVANVMNDPEAYGVPAKPELGWCGLGGKPEVGS
ncbi:hypothetical protein [Ruegeria sp. EL01]|uniref:hypothetical protein n=1 Tax=Ruegeria sp. EL01 TaxID=2107578 RepID=UPI000EA7FF5D|nr:hypothetical protein [Ruegeria sp. EL01]